MKRNIFLKFAITKPLISIHSLFAGMLNFISRLFIISIILVFCLILYSNVIINSFEKYTFDNKKDVPNVYCAIVLGTSKFLKNGKENKYYKNRILSAYALYKSGKCIRIIVSGDNRTNSYNEPRNMKYDLIQLGVKGDDIICDYAGLRTLDSIIRFKEVFSQEKGVVVSQKFHNSRAIYIGRSNGIELYGFNAVDVDSYNGFKTRVREIASKFVCFLDVHVLRTRPKHRGPKIAI